MGTDLKSIVGTDLKSVLRGGGGVGELIVLKISRL
jgi:hypothetical protein